MSRSLLSRAAGLAWLALALACSSSARVAPKASAAQASAGRTGGDRVVLPNPAKSAGAGGSSIDGAQAGEPAPVDKAAVATNAGAGSGASAGASGSASASDACEDGKTRCSSFGGGRRERCQGGQWKSAIACTSSEVCSPDGECRLVTERCRGSAGQPVCDGGVLHLCNADGSEGPPQNCMSARQCQAGIALRSCPPCSPGDYRCTDTKLERCSDAGDRWLTEDTCMSAGLCNAEAHACTKAACLPDTFTCTNDRLRKCKSDQSGFEDMGQLCAAGTCDAKAGKCLACVPGKKGCDGTTALSCSADGSNQTRKPCSGNAPYCAEGSGQCVQCTGNAARECPQPAQVCRAATCNAGTGMCETGAAATGADCATLGMSGGHCNDQGVCVECLENAHCRGKQGREYCNLLSGRCAECATNAQCDTDDFKGCSALGQCVDVAGCGNRVVDALAGEECDPTAPNWSTQTCDADSCTRRIYVSCGVLSGRCSRDQCSANRVCARSCSSAADCPRLPGYQVACSSAGQCYLPCNGNLTSCPLGLLCNTELDPAQCVGVL